MSTAVQGQAVLPVSNIEAAIVFYAAIGFDEPWTYGDPPTRGGMRLGSVAVQFVEASPGRGPSSAWFLMTDAASYESRVRTSLSELPAALSRLTGADARLPQLLNGLPPGRIVCPLTEMSPRTVEFTLEDPFGNHLTFAQRVRRPKPAGDVPGLQIECRRLTAEEHRVLSEAVGWGPFIYRPNVPDQISRLEVTMTAIIDGRAVGAASMAGDGRYIHIIGDVMVLPEFQGRGIGTRLMRALDEWLVANGSRNAFVCLFAAADRLDYYRQFGFNGPEGGLVGMSKVTNVE